MTVRSSASRSSIWLIASGTEDNGGRGKAERVTAEVPVAREPRSCRACLHRIAHAQRALRRNDAALRHLPAAPSPAPARSSPSTRSSASSTSATTSGRGAVPPPPLAQQWQLAPTRAWRRHLPAEPAAALAAAAAEARGAARRIAPAPLHRAVVCHTAGGGAASAAGRAGAGPAARSSAARRPAGAPSASAAASRSSSWRRGSRRRARVAVQRAADRVGGSARGGAAARQGAGTSHRDRERAEAVAADTIRRCRAAVLRPPQRELLPELAAAAHAVFVSHRDARDVALALAQGGSACGQGARSRRSSRRTRRGRRTRATTCGTKRTVATAARARRGA